MDVYNYLKKICDKELDKNYWFITKQTLSDFYSPFYIAQIIDDFQNENDSKIKFHDFYVQKLKEDTDMIEKFPSQAKSVNTYRNAIIPEYFGLTKREDSNNYKDAEITDSYKTLAKYIKKYSDVNNYRTFIDHQIEKTCVNVNKRARKYKEVSSVTVFMTIFLYKILLLLYKKYGNSTLYHEEFIMFVIRAKSYDEVHKVFELIVEYRNKRNDPKIEKLADKIMHSKSSENTRFDALLGTLSPLEYKTNTSFEIIDDDSCRKYVETVVELYENSKWSNCTDEEEIVSFMRSSEYFFGTIDGDIVSVEPYKNYTKTSQKVKSDVKKRKKSAAKKTINEIQKAIDSDKIKSLLNKLVKEYGIKGTVSTSSVIRIPAVQSIFRNELLAKYGQKCIMCDISHKELLVASHIKQSSKCDIFGKAASDNGFLMCTIHDSLFDKFFITFDSKTGEIKVSELLSENDIKSYNIDTKFKLPDFLMSKERQKYLEWHNKEFEKKEKSRK